jgi:hypothetical protein
MATSLARSVGTMTGTLSEPCKRPDSMPLVITGEMGIPQPHRDVFMVHQFCHRGEVHSSHQRTARRGVPHIMQRAICKPSLCPPSSNAERQEQQEVSLELQKATLDCQPIHSNCLQRCRQHVVHRNTTACAIFRNVAGEIQPYARSLWAAYVPLRW